mgnify:FL=1|tara:strand:+ start:218 stop:436 length:219 start_codon:yes stop_codon:yes gene_type:complete
MKEIKIYDVPFINILETIRSYVKDYDNDNAISSIDNLLRIIKEKEDVSNGRAKLLAVRDIVLNDSVVTIEGV